MKTTLLSLLLCIAANGFGQISPQSYQIKENSESFDVVKLNIDMLDLYRGQDYDNEITIDDQGKKIVVLLLSANKLKSMGIPFNEGLVKKGAMMVGPVTSAKRYKIELTAERNLNFISSY